MPGLLDRLNHLEPEQRRYTLETLAARLREAEQFDRLCLLFADDSWMRARYTGSGGIYDGVIADVAVAWQGVAVPQTRRELESDKPRALAACVRYALITTSVASVAANLPPALVAKALRTGLWAPTRALSAAARSTSDQLYLVVLESGTLDRVEHERTQRAALARVLAISLDDHRAEGLARLAPHLDGAALEQALAAARGFEAAELRVKTLVPLAGALEGEARGEALKLASRSATSIKSLLERSVALAPALGFLPDEARRQTLADAVRMARAIKGDRDRTKAFTAIARGLDGPDRSDVAEEAMQAALALEAFDLAFELRDLLAVLDEHQAERLIAATFPRMISLKDIDREADLPRPVALIALGPHLRGDDRAKARSIALAMSTTGPVSSIRPEVLTAIARAFEGEERAKLVREALGPARSSPYRSSSLVLLEGEARATAVQEALEEARGLGDGEPQANEPTPRLKVLGDLAPLLEGELLERAIGTAGEIKDYEAQAKALVTLAQALSGDARAAVMQAGFEALWQLSDSPMGMFPICDTLPRLDGPVVAKALDAVLKLSAEGVFSSDRAAALKALAPQLSGGLLQRAYAAALGFERAEDRAAALAPIAGRLSGAQRLDASRGALAAIPQMRGAEYLRANAVRDLAPYLDGNLAREAWDLVLSLEREVSEYAAAALVALAPRLEADFVREGARALMKLVDGDQRVTGLAALLPKLDGRSRRRALAAATNATLTTDDWRVHPEHCAAALGPYLEAPDRQLVLSKGLNAALAIGNHEMGADALVALAPHLAPRERSSVLRQALERVLRVADPRRRAELLDAVLPALDPDALAESLELVREISAASDRAQVLASFARQLTSSPGLVLEVRALLLDQLSARKEQSRKDVLEILAYPALFEPPVFPPELVEQIATAVNEICRGWNWL